MDRMSDEFATIRGEDKAGVCAMIENCGDGWKVYCGNCLDVMAAIPDNSIDSIVTDPPYGLSFMGKKWDYDVPSEAIWRECLRVLKPGGHLLAFAGTRTQHRMAVRIEDAGFEIRDLIAWVYASGFPKSHNLKGDWQGWGTALKPALEPITVARKPLIGTVAENVLAHGTGALNVDGCRIGTDGGTAGATAGPSDGIYGNGLNGERSQPVAGLGRWPANVILDESQAAELDRQSGVSTSQGGKHSGSSGTRDEVGGYGYDRQEIDRPTDTGGASRFFYTAKADSSERPRVNGIAHPTVKPLDLMRYLVRLVTPPGGVVLEPFAGSGTTLEAAVIEGFRAIGIERETDYLPLITQRLTKPIAPVMF
jgi:site-specific DNA-methyltransferase (adenine-specific)